MGVTCCWYSCCSQLPSPSLGEAMQAKLKVAKAPGSQDTLQQGLETQSPPRMQIFF